jgi:hypothetical protein
MSLRAVVSSYRPIDGKGYIVDAEILRAYLYLSAMNSLID